MGDSHGFAYIIDLNSKQFKQVLDWRKIDINWEGRGGDRGLRGIIFYNNSIYIAASREILIFDKDFRLVESLTNKYLRFIHEVYKYEHNLYIVSTGFDSILVLDLKSNTFTKAYHLKQRKFYYKLEYFWNKIQLKPFLIYHILRMILKPLLKLQIKRKIRLRFFNPNTNDGPKQCDTFHLNAIFCRNNNIFFSGTQLPYLLFIKNNKLHFALKIPRLTHNVQPFDDYIIYNDTYSNQIAIQNLKGDIIKTYKITKFEKSQTKNADSKEYVARPTFGRGLCILNKNLIIGGFSPASISVYQIGLIKPIFTINLTMDVTNSVCSLAVWPYK